ncbi:ABC transporter permease [Chitinophaga cymbidii]|uniref:ABC transporter permease n=1 Tax=Chitinophaga cymbidii TaxID=1096750 RepID=A0A512RLQ3_9BACT|nr:ABC transporter permease [Chitinophaga cymbidii]GEP96633.1 ABC transporter permease [Chitinophaga cymbidii]
MFRNYLKIAWRNLLKNKTFSIINIAGLAIGMAACITIMLFVLYEKGFDGQHKKNIYRLCEVQSWEGMNASQKVALSMYPMATALQREYPEVRNYTRIMPNGHFDLNYGEKRFYLPKMLWVDSTFLQLFDFPLLKGDRRTALQERNSVVLSTSAAAKLFGTEDPIGKTVRHFVGDTLPFTVTGLMEVPQNSHLQFDALFSANTVYNPQWDQNWGGNWLITYLELAPGANVAALEKKFPAFLKKYMAEDDRWKDYELFLQALPDVHAGSTEITHDYANFRKFDRRYTYIFSMIAGIILLIACINFMNLSTARSSERAREVGIRKSIGAHRYQLARQFIGESVILSLIALVFAILLVKVTLPWVAAFSERPLELPLFSDLPKLLLIIGGTLLVGVLAGLYPSAYLSSFKAVRVLKGSPQTGRNKGTLRNVLVVGQFTGAVFLIIATIFVLKQLRYMQTKDRGFNGDQIMLIPLDSETNRHYETLKQELTGNTLITAVTASQQRLGNNIHQGGVRFHGKGPVRDLVTSGVVVDCDYLRTYRIKLIAGSDFSRDKANNAREYIINESLAKELLREERSDEPLASLVGKHFGYGGMDSVGRIIGITKDFNFNTLHHKIETLMMFSQRDWGYGEMSVKISAEKAKEAVAYIESVWNRHVTGHPFEYTFLDQHFASIYNADRQVSRIVGILATLAIIISCLGLFGLATFAAERRVKEIGIRKALGATVENIVTMLSKDFVRLVVIANLIAWPLAWFGVNRWLEDFAYHIDISWWVFIMAGVIAVMIALLTVSFQAVKAGLTNPVKSLRME